MKQFLIKHTGLQKAGKFNIEWIKDKDVNGNIGYRNIKTGQFRTTVPNSQEERQQEQRKNNIAALKQYSADSAKYNRERATRKNHSDEIVKKVISKPSLVMRNNGKTTIVRSKELAPGEDSAKLNTTIEEQIPMFKGLNLVTGLGKLALSKMGQNEFSHWARNSVLNETAGNLTKNVSKGITNNLAIKEYTAGDNPIIQLSYYKPTRKSWSTGKAEGNEATSYFFKQQPNQRFELVKDIEPNNYSVHFKTDRNGLSYGNKMQLFAKIADEVPEGSNLSTWGSVSKGGIHGINRFGKDFGFIQNGTRQLTMKGTKEPVEVGIFQKPKLDQDMVRLYRASGTNGKFTPSPDGTAKYTGMWFTNNPRKTLIYASNTRRKALKEGIDNPIELQYIDIPKTQLNQYKASNIIGNDPNIEYEINEDFLIPLNMKRNRIPLKGITGNILRDSRLTIPELDPNVFKIAAPIGMSLPFLNNSQK